MKRARLIPYLCTAGIAMLTYLLVLHYGEGLSICNINQAFNCEVANRSAYSEFFGVPMSAIGIALLSSIIALYKMGPTKMPHIFILCSAAVAPCVYLTYVQITVLGSICIFCELTKFAIYAVLFISLSESRKGGLLQFEF